MRKKKTKKTKKTKKKKKKKKKKRLKKKVVAKNRSPKGGSRDARALSLLT